VTSREPSDVVMKRIVSFKRRSIRADTHLVKNDHCKCGKSVEAA